MLNYKNIEFFNVYNLRPQKDLFYAMSHGVNRATLKEGVEDDRIIFLQKLQSMTNNVKFDLYGINNVQPIWADHYFKTISNAKMGLNLSRGEAIKYYSSDRIAQLILEKIETPEMILVDSLENTKRGSGGFGSTGV